MQMQREFNIKSIRMHLSVNNEDENLSLFNNCLQVISQLRSLFQLGVVFV